MSDFRIKTCVLGPVSTNCYLVYNDTTKEAVAVDPGDNGDYILNKWSETIYANKLEQWILS